MLDFFYLSNHSEDSVVNAAVGVNALCKPKGQNPKGERKEVQYGMRKKALNTLSGAKG